MNVRLGVVVLPIVSALSFCLATSSTSEASANALDARARRSAAVFRELGEMPDKVPPDLIARSRCVAVVPHVIKAAWFVGGHYGKGVLSCRSKYGEWSPPVHVLLTGGSFGLQFGASSSDVVLFFMTEESVHSLLSSKIKLSGEAGVAAGPVGRKAEAATDLKLGAEIYSYARSRGLFLGMSLEGAYLGVADDDTRDYYRRSDTAESILFEHRISKLPKSASDFVGSLPGTTR